jgi:hypothetical protein
MQPAIRSLLTTLAALALLIVRTVVAAESAEYKPPRGGIYTMDGHFTWCGEGRTPAERLKRYESFWSEHRPKERDGYDDSHHVRTVRRCAYRLAQLYGELGRQKDCLRMIQWLEKEDDALNIGEE